MMFIGYCAAFFIVFIMLLVVITVLLHFWPLLIVGAVVWFVVWRVRK